MINKSKTYVTRDGDPVRIYSTGNDGPYPVHGAIFFNHAWSVSSWPEDGAVPGQFSLVEVKPKRMLSVVASVYIDDGGELRVGGLYHSKEEAAAGAKRKRFACVHITREITEGEGL